MKKRKNVTPAEKEKIEYGKHLYNCIKGKCFYCALLQADVYFTNKGWMHLNSNRRNISDILRRIELLPWVDSVIKNPTGILQSKKNENCTIIYGRRRITSSKGIYKYLTIKVNVIKDKSGKYIFLSIC